MVGPLVEKLMVGRGVDSCGTVGRKTDGGGPVGRGASSGGTVGRKTDGSGPVGKEASGDGTVGRKTDGVGAVGRGPTVGQLVERPMWRGSW